MLFRSYGTIDELNSYIGLVRDCATNSATDGTTTDCLKEVQDRLFTIGSNLATDGEYKVIPDVYVADVERLEQEIDAMNAVLPELKNFILPGGHTTVSFCHVARCVCRRAERLAAALHESEPLDPLILQYLNRLSDYLFVLSRHLAQAVQVKEVIWVSRKK